MAVSLPTLFFRVGRGIEGVQFATGGTDELLCVRLRMGFKNIALTLATSRRRAMVSAV